MKQYGRATTNDSQRWRGYTACTRRIEWREGKCNERFDIHYGMHVLESRERSTRNEQGKPRMHTARNGSILTKCIWINNAINEDIIQSAHTDTHTQKAVAILQRKRKWIGKKPFLIKWHSQHFEMQVGANYCTDKCIHRAQWLCATNQLFQFIFHFKLEIDDGINDSITCMCASKCIYACCSTKHGPMFTANKGQDRLENGMEWNKATKKERNCFNFD